MGSRKMGPEMSFTGPHRTPRMRRQKWAKLEIAVTPALVLFVKNNFEAGKVAQLGEGGLSLSLIT